MEKKDRFIISNQLKILEALYPGEASYYSQCRTAFEEGYEDHYSWAMENIDSSTLNSDDTKEVRDTLDMYRAIYFYRRDHGQGGFNEFALKFQGYDGNDSVENKLMGYARYFVADLQRFSEVLETQGEHFDFNSHQEMRGKYQRMLAIWLDIPAGVDLGCRHNLTAEQVAQILDA